jgi:hypothetical protein
VLHLPRELASSCELTPRARFTCHSLLAVGGNLYSVIQFESPLPSVFYLMQLTTAANGALSITPGTLTPVSFAPYGGSLFMCAGTTSPWQSHLGGEESACGAEDGLKGEREVRGASERLAGTHTAPGSLSLAPSHLDQARLQRASGEQRPHTGHESGHRGRVGTVGRRSKKRDDDEPGGRANLARPAIEGPGSPSSSPAHHPARTELARAR